MENSFFKRLSDTDLIQYQAWARDNYKPGQKINLTWHPAIRMQCERMNLEQVQRGLDYGFSSMLDTSEDSHE